MGSAATPPVKASYVPAPPPTPLAVPAGPLSLNGTISIRRRGSSKIPSVPTIAEASYSYSLSGVRMPMHI